MPKSALITCQCCGAAKSMEQFKPLTVICLACLGLPIDSVVRLTRATLTREHASYDTNKQDKRATKRSKALALHALNGKRCSACWHAQPITNFDACETRTDGLQANCRVCNKLYVTLRATGGMPLWRATRDAMRATAGGNK